MAEYFVRAEQNEGKYIIKFSLVHYEFVSSRIPQIRKMRRTKNEEKEREGEESKLIIIVIIIGSHRNCVACCLRVRGERLMAFYFCIFSM